MHNSTQLHDTAVTVSHHKFFAHLRLVGRLKLLYIKVDFFVKSINFAQNIDDYALGNLMWESDPLLGVCA